MKKTSFLWLIIIILTSQPLLSQNTNYSNYEFPHSSQWLNTNKPVSFQELSKNRVTLLYFWNLKNQRDIETLQKLDSLYTANPKFNLIGIHQPLSEMETNENFLQRNLSLNNITFPIYNDLAKDVQARFQTESNSPYILIDKKGEQILLDNLNPTAQELAIAIQQAISNPPSRTFPRRSTQISKGSQKYTLLSHPRVITSDPGSGRIFISDTDHNRIIICAIEGEVEGFAGSGKASLKNGNLSNAAFHHPQGLAYDVKNNWLYVADTRNNAIRKIDLSQRMVSTTLDFSIWNNNHNLELGQPGKMALHDSSLYWIDLDHQNIIQYDLQEKKCRVFQEPLTQGKGDNITTSYIHSFCFGENNDVFLTTDAPPYLYHRNKSGTQPIIIAKNNSGDMSFESPRGIVWRDNQLITLDYYNGQMTILETDNDQVIQSHLDKTDLAYIQGGVDMTLLGDKLFVANALSNTIEQVNLTDNQIKPFVLKNLKQLFPLDGQRADVQVSDTIALNAEGQTEIQLTILPPENHIFNPNAQSNLYNNDRSEMVFDDHFINGSAKTIIIFPDDVKDFISLTGTIQYCHKDHPNWCYRKEYNYITPIVLSEKVKRAQPLTIQMKDQ